MDKFTLGIAVVAVLLAVGSFFYSGSQSPLVGGTTNYDTVSATGLSIGVGCNSSFGSCAGTTMTSIITGTCNATFSGTSLAATSTGKFLCTVSGVLSGDKVFVSLPSTARSAANQWFAVVDGYATTTDTIGFDMANWNGVATTSFAQATTGIQYYVVR